MCILLNDTSHKNPQYPRLPFLLARLRACLPYCQAARFAPGVFCRQSVSLVPGAPKKRDTRFTQMSLLTLDKRDGERALKPFPKMPPKNYFFKVATPSAMRLQPSTTYERGQARFMRR